MNTRSKGKNLQEQTQRETKSKGKSFQEQTQRENEARRQEEEEEAAKLAAWPAHFAKFTESCNAIERRKKIASDELSRCTNEMYHLKKDIQKHCPHSKTKIVEYRTYTNLECEVCDCYRGTVREWCN